MGNKPNNDVLSDAKLFAVDVITPEYSKIIQYLTFQTFSSNFNEKLKRRLILKCVPYMMIGKALYKEGKDGVLRCSIYQTEVSIILEGCHLDSCGGYFAEDNMACKALQVGY